MNMSKQKQRWESSSLKASLNQGLGWECDVTLEKEGRKQVKRVKHNLQLPLELVYSHPQQVSNTTYQIAIQMYIDHYSKNTSKVIKYTKKDIAALSAACNKTILKAMKELMAIGLVVEHQAEPGKATKYSLKPVKTGQFFDCDSLELRLIKLTIDELRLYTAFSTETKAITINEVIEKIQMPKDKAEAALQGLVTGNYIVKVSDGWNAIR